MLQTAEAPNQEQGISEYEALSLAEDFYRQGNVQQAVLISEQILHGRPHYAFVHDLLARIYLSSELPQMARTHSNQAVAGDSLNPKFKHTHVQVLRDCQDWRRAEREVRELAHMAPNWAETWLLYGQIQFSLGDIHTATAAFTVGLELDPDHIGLRLGYGKLMMDIGQNELSEEHFSRLLQLDSEHLPANLFMHLLRARKGERKEAIEHIAKLYEKHPDDVDVMLHYANLLREEQNRGEAMTLYEKVLQVDAYNMAALMGIGLGLSDLSHHKQAKHWFDRAQLEDPDRPELWAGMAVALSGMGQVSEALNYSRRAVRMNPNYPDGLNNLGLLLVEADDLYNARKHYYRSMEVSPTYQEALFNIGLLDLLAGNLDDGWEGYAMRWEASTLKGFKPIYPSEEWDGRADLSGKVLLLYTEQGFGDCLQFVRYADMVQERYPSVKIVMHCQPELVETFETVKSLNLVLAKDLAAPPAEHGKSIPRIDYHQALLTLPQLMRTRLRNVPIDIPYIHTRPDYEVELPEKDSDLMKIAVTWSSNLANIKLLKRNMPFTNLEPLFKIEGARFYNMQLSEPHAEGQAFFDDGRLIDLKPLMGNFANTASLLKQIDLVVSVDTGLVHLCGAMGVPVWVMMPYSADWRWLSGLETNQWYPSLRIMRQSVSHSWKEVLEWVEHDLRARIRQFHAEKS
ncbi:MAG: tetratricopeptide repeat protein [Gammaproteobacteria bacterium AqS3]|nr:tetratricopeptide repeat protein [Gammaproteobacteria bacterium AqS3]